MKVALVHMPWGALDVPSLALGIMRAVAVRHGHDVEVRYANLDFVDWIVGKTTFDLQDYQYFSEESYFLGAGDWVFSGALYGGPRPFESFSRHLADRGAGPDEIAMTGELHRLVPDFVSWLVTELEALEPDVVGFTSTFQQNAASLAAARLLKQRHPSIRTVLGGANCDGPQGAALHRNFAFLDYVVRGEGEAAFPLLLDAITAGKTDLSGIGGLCWRAADGTSLANPMVTRPLPPGQIVEPDYEGFIDRLDASGAADWVSPKLVVEGSRGCWWGEKHHCTFCGLNGTFMEFRSKSPQRFLDEVLRLARRHQLLDFIVVDNILDMAYFDSVLLQLAESDYDFRLHFEIKANLRRHHFQRLSDSGAVQVQPGVESLNTHVLRLMDKGVTGCQNVRALRDAKSAGVTTSWNYLYGFPGETTEDYSDIIRQMPMLHHLEPPVGAARIAIERFSPYFTRPELGFPDLRPAPQYQEIFELPEEELTDLAYIFASAPQGIDRVQAAVLDEAIAAWRAAYPTSRLTYQELSDRIVLVSRRPGCDWSVLELVTPTEIALFRLLGQPRTPEYLHAKTSGGNAVTAILDDWSRLGILFTDGGFYVHTAVESDNQALTCIGDRSIETETAEPRAVADATLRADEESRVATVG